MLARLVVNLTAQYGNLVSGLRSAQGYVSRFAGGVRGAMNELGTLPGLIAGSAAFGAAAWMLKTASSAEQLRMQLKVLTGSAELGAQTFKELEQFALKTSFSLESAGESARNLLASGVKRGEIIGTMTVLGNLAMGDAERLKLLAKAYTDVMNKGKLQAQELRQFAENGVGLVQQLATMYGKTAQEILAMSEAGQIGFGDMRNALLALTGEGGRFEDMMGQMATTTAGRWETLKESVAVFARQITDQILPSVNAGLEYANSVVSQAGEWWTWLQNIIADELTLIMSYGQFVWENLGNIGAMAFLTTQLHFMRLAGSVQHFFTGVMPALLTWFGNNWRDIFTTVYNFTSTVFTNLGKNVRSIMTAIWEFIKSGGTGSLTVAWTPLTDGFVNAVKELPDIPERVVGPLEQELQARVNELGTTISDSFGQIMAENFGSLDEMRKQAEKVTNAVPEPAPLGPGETLANKGSGKEDKSFSPLLKGSADAYKAIVAAMTGKDEKTTIAKAQLEEQKKQAKATEEIAKKFEKGQMVLAMVDNLG